MATIQSSTDPRFQPTMSLRERLSRIISGATSYLPSSMQSYPDIPQMGVKQGKLAEDLMAPVSNLPVVGQALSAEDLGTAAHNKDYWGMGLAALGLVPGGGPEAKVAKQVVEGVADVGKVAKGAEKAVKAAPSGGQFNLKPEGGGKKRMSQVESLRDKPLTESIEAAKQEPHIIPHSEAEGGGFVGAPYSMQTRADLDMIREKFDADVAAGVGGSDWYPRAQEWIKTVAGPDPARQSELARNLALFSAQADPGGNLGFSIKARNNAIMGSTPISEEYKPGQGGVVRTGQQWDTYLKGFNTGKDIKLGDKTGVYGGHLDPTREDPTTGTNDIWHARAFGYTTPEGQPWESALGSTQHTWLDYETVLATERANRLGLGGRTDWTPGEIQASPWVAGKGRGLAEEKFNTKSQGEYKQGPITQEQLQAGIDEASKTYPDYARQYTANATHEAVTGRQTAHLPGVAQGDQATRDEFSRLLPSGWQGPGGRDILYGSQGAYTAPTVQAEGVYGNPVQMNEQQIAQPLVAFSGPSGERVVEPASRQMLTGTEGFRAYMDAQDMGAWSIPIPGQKAGQNNAFELAFPNGAPTRENLAHIMAQGGAAEKTPMPNVIHSGGDRGVLTNFGKTQSPIGAKEAKAMQAQLGGAAKVTPTKLDTGNVDYEEAWRGGAPEGQVKQGTDMATKKMLGNLNAAQLEKLDTPEIRQKVLDNMERDAAVALKTGDVTRADIQKAREIFGKFGFKGLQEHLGKGLLPAAIGAIVYDRIRNPRTAGEERQREES